MAYTMVSLAGAQRRWQQRKARRRRTARWRQRGGSSLEAEADSPAPFANAPTHTPSNATDWPTYASLSLVEDGGTTAPTALSSLAATALSVETSTAVTNAPLPPTMMLPMLTPTATATTSFVKLNLI